MILLKIHSQSLGIFPLEGDAPGTVYVDRITLRFAVQSMKVKTGLSQAIERADRVQSIQPHERTTVQITSHLGRLSRLEKLSEATVFEAADHA